MRGQKEHREDDYRKDDTFRTEGVLPSRVVLLLVLDFS
jgi:hypothetical protein